uniref:SDR family NAD(P)-dependent oxidoreductase n=1 Tax=Paraburkholderia sp. J63 TaxID=2805434 RepID=UPI002ABE5633
TAELFLRAGASVAICGRDNDRLARAGRELRERHPQAQLLAARCDVLDAADVAAFAGEVEKRFGRADMLVNNAGQGRV